MSGDEKKEKSLLELAREAQGRASADSEDIPEGGLFEADFFCLQRWPDDEARYGERAGRYHGRFHHTIPRAKRGKSWPCPICGEWAGEVPGAPRVYKASNPTGLWGQREVREHVKAAELEAQAIDLDPSHSDRQEIEKEVFERTKIKE